MKQIFTTRKNLIIGMSVLVAGLASCTKENTTNEPIPVTPIVQENDIPDGNTTVNYSVQVVPVGDVGSRGLLAATVTIQANGVVKTATVDASGIAVFNGLAPGRISGHVKAAGYSSINFTANLNEINSDNDDDHTDYAASTIYLPKNNAAVSGRIYGDYNLDGNTSLTQSANFQSVNVWVAYVMSGYPMGAGNGMLSSVAMDTMFFSKASDIAGNFTITGLPNTMNGVAAVVGMEEVTKVDAASSATVGFNFNPVAVSLIPGVTTQFGDKYAN